MTEAGSSYLAYFCPRAIVLEVLGYHIKFTLNAINSIIIQNVCHLYLQCYIQALTNPESENYAAIPASLMKTLGPRSKEHFNLELQYGVVISFPEETTAHIAGSALDVMLAMSKLEDLIKIYSKTSQPKANRPLADFALKLGYEQEQVNTVFEKLGPTVDKNTFLKELINVSGAGSRIPDDRWSPVSPRIATVVPTGMLPSPTINSQMYGADTGVVARGVMPRSSVKTMPSNVPQGYHMPVGSGISSYNRDLGVLPLHNDGVVARGFLPRTTAPSTQGISANSSGVVARGFMPRTPAPSMQGNGLTATDGIGHTFMPRTTSQTTQGSNTTYSNLYLGQGSEYALNAEPQQVDQMVNQMASRYQQLPQSDVRHIVIDGSNVAMR